MNQGATDQEEWQMDENWGGPKWGEVYFRKKDPRINRQILNNKF